MRTDHRLRATIIVSLLAMVLAPLPVALAGQLDSATYFGLARGMSESELLVRAGQPDLITSPGGEIISQRTAVTVPDDPDPRLRLIGYRQTSRFIERKDYHYIPDYTEHDPHLTIVSLRGGRIFRIERTKLLTRPKPPSPSATVPAVPAAPARPSDADIRMQRAERVLSAAEAYAATRARLKDGAVRPERSETRAEGENASLYRGTAADGVRYFGDRPLDVVD